MRASKTRKYSQQFPQPISDHRSTPVEHSRAARCSVVSIKITTMPCPFDFTATTMRCICKKLNERHHTSLQNRRYFFAFFRRARAGASRARSARHARREGRKKRKFSRPSRRACLALRARLALSLAPLKNQKKNSACSTG